MRGSSVSYTVNCIYWLCFVATVPGGPEFYAVSITGVITAVLLRIRVCCDVKACGFTFILRRFETHNALYMLD